MTGGNVSFPNLLRIDIEGAFAKIPSKVYKKAKIQALDFLQTQHLTFSKISLMKQNRIGFCIVLSFY